MKLIAKFSRFIFGSAACVLLVASGMAALDVPHDLPLWRIVAGLGLWAASAMVFDKFVAES